MARKFTTRKEFINPGDLKKGPYQRRLDRPFVKKIVAEFDQNKLGVIHVSKRANGSYYILDGQHRVEAIRALGDQWKTQIECRVYDKLTLQEEADLFDGLNRVRPVRQFDRFIAAAMAGNPEVVEIVKIVKANGFKVSNSTSTGMTCVAALTKIYKKCGPKVLHAVLSVCGKAWGTETAPHGAIVAGLGRFLYRYGQDVDLNELTKRLSERGGGQTKLLGDGRGYCEVNGGSVEASVADVILAEWNKKRRSGRLDPIRNHRDVA